VDGRRGEFDLSDYEWKNRVLIAFAPSSDDAALIGLRGRWDKEKDGVADRNLMLMEVLEQGKIRAGDVRLAPSVASKLREQFRVKSGASTFILIGKDGTEKLRRSTVRLSELFDVIDAMPMRRAEMLRSATSEARPRLGASD
jgi:hypothetical protein